MEAEINRFANFLARKVKSVTKASFHAGAKSPATQKNVKLSVQIHALSQTRGHIALACYLAVLSEL